MSEWGPNGRLAEAFGMDEGTNKGDAPDNEKTASPDNRYPIEDKEQAERSLERAKKNESPEAFEKMAERIISEYPELESEKLAGVGYQLGREFARGMVDELS